MDKVAYALHKFAGDDPDFLPPHLRPGGSDVKQEDTMMMT